MAGPIAGQAGGIANNVSGAASATSNASTLLIAAGGQVPAQRIFVNAYSLSNSSATTIQVNFQDGQGGTTLWTQTVPAGGGANLSNSATPLFWTSPGNALYFAASTGESTIYANAAGFLGIN